MACSTHQTREIRADVLIAGAGLGGCAAAWAALRRGRTVLLTEETDWIGGQMTAQAVPPDEIAAIILLSDGADTQSQLKLEALLPLIAFDAERRPVRIFTIGYGKQAPEILRKIAESTQAKNYTGDKDTIRAVFRDIATFF